MKVVLEGVSIHAGRRTLIADATVEFGPGQLHVIVGPSGAGKSLLLQFIAGLMGPDQVLPGIRVSGNVAYMDAEKGTVLQAERVCLVPQQGGVFLEFTTDANVRFGADHRLSDAGALSPEAAMALLGVPSGRPGRYLSGGEARRCAVARALSAGAKVLLFDEPTAGLDPVAAERMANLIAETARTQRVTTIVVTHDYEEFLPVADRVYVLHPRTRRIEPVEGATRGFLSQVFSETEEQEEATAEGGQFGARQAVLRLLDGLGELAVMPARALRYTFPTRVSVPWLWRFFRHYARYVIGPSALVYLVVAGLVAGFVSTYFTFKYLPYRHVLEPLVMENVVSGIGFTLYRVTVPVLATLLIAARCGSAIAADVGIKSQTRQLDAMRSVGASPRGYLQFSVLWALVLGSLVLGAIAYCGAMVSSMLTFSALYPDRGGLFWRRWFNAALQVHGAPAWWLDGTFWVVARLALSGWISGMVAFDIAATPKRSEVDVSQGITRTVLVATLLVLLLHVTISLLEFRVEAF